MAAPRLHRSGPPPGPAWQPLPAFVRTLWIAVHTTAAIAQTSGRFADTPQQVAVSVVGDWTIGYLGRTRFTIMQTETCIRSTLASVLAMLWTVLTAARAAPRHAVARRAERCRDRPALTHWAPSAIGVVLGVNAIVGVAAAQSNSVCGTTIATGTQDAARFVVGLLVVGCIVTAAVAEGYARLKRDPQEAAQIKKWRNNAAIGSVSTPSIMWLVVQIAGFYNIPVVRCIDLVPFL